MNSVSPIRIMIDLETLSADHTAGILTIGAVKFGTALHVDSQPYFYDKVLPQDNARYNLHEDVATLEWWDKQDPEVRQEAFSGIKPLRTVLSDFTAWVERIANHVPLSEIELWSRGADFDLVILSNAYYEVFGEYPFNFRKHMCERTLRALLPSTVRIEFEESYEGRKHYALMDAKYQAHIATRTLQYLSATGAIGT